MPSPIQHYLYTRHMYRNLDEAAIRQVLWETVYTFSSVEFNDASLLERVMVPAVYVEIKSS